MQASEALQRVIAAAIGAEDGRSIDPDDENYKQDQVAIAICQAVLNTAIPVARFRAFFQIDNIPGKQDGYEYTICAVSIGEIQAALRHAGWKSNIQVQVTLWEQEQAGAEMLSGYQGATSQQYRKWVDSLDHFQDGVSVN